MAVGVERLVEIKSSHIREYHPLKRDVADRILQRWREYRASLPNGQLEGEFYFGLRAEGKTEDEIKEQIKAYNDLKKGK